MPLCVGKRRTRRLMQLINHAELANVQAVFPRHQRHARSFPAERSPPLAAHFVTQFWQLLTAIALAGNV